MKKLLLSSIMIALACTVQAQNIKWETGNLKLLKEEKNIATKMIFDGLTISGMPEQEFVAQQVEADNKEKAGTGDKFKSNWEGAKEKGWLDRFNKYATGYTKKKITVGAAEADSKYTIVLQPTNMELGKGKMYGTKPALVDMIITIVETANPENIIAKGTAMKVQGISKAPKGTGFMPGGGVIDAVSRAQNLEPTMRVGESFELIAKKIGDDLK